MTFEELNKEARRLYAEYQNGNITEAEYSSAIASLLMDPLDWYIYSALGVTNRQDHDDLLQTVMLKFVQTMNPPDLSDGLSLPWFFKVARNERIDETRRTKPSVPIDEQTCFVSDTRRSVEDRRIFVLAAQDAFSDLKPELREVAFLYFQERFSQSEIAETCDLPETTVNYYVSQARKHLSAKLGEFASEPVQRSETSARSK